MSRADITKSIIEESYDLDTDIKINPEFYIHTALLNAQKSILLSVVDGKTSDGVNAYIIYIRHIQMIAVSAGFLDEETIKDIKNIQEQPNATDIISKAKQASDTLGLMLKDIFSNKTQYGSLTFDPKKLVSVLDEYDLGKKEE